MNASPNAANDIPGETWQKRQAIAIWAGLIAVMVGLALAGDKHRVNEHYFRAATSWLSGEDFYTDDGRGFLYAPTSVVLYIPFVIFPEPLSDALWRLVAIGTFATGVWRVTGLSNSPRRSHGQAWAALLSLLVGVAACRNGQATVPMAGAMLHAAACIARQRWNGAAFWLVLALVLKPIAVPFVMLAAVLHRPLWSRTAVGFVLAALLPFACQTPEYVVDQYRQFGRMLAVAYDLGDHDAWAQGFAALRIWGLDTPRPVQTLVRLTTAAGALVLLWKLSAKLSRPKFVMALYTVATIWTMLFNPRTENNTYMMMGPILGWLAAGIDRDRLPRWQWHLAFVLLCTVGIGASYELSKLLAPGKPFVWLAPLATSVLAIYVAVSRATYPLDTAFTGVLWTPVPPENAPLLKPKA